MLLFLTHLLLVPSKILNFCLANLSQKRKDSPSSHSDYFMIMRMRMAQGQSGLVRVRVSLPTDLIFQVSCQSILSCPYGFKSRGKGSHLVAQWLEFQAFTTMTWVQSLVGELRFHRPLDKYIYIHTNYKAISI